MFALQPRFFNLNSQHCEQEEWYLFLGTRNKCQILRGTEEQRQRGTRGESEQEEQENTTIYFRKQGNRSPLNDVEKYKFM